ncbi:energy-coupling factor ABC transporter permease [Alkalibacter mobilis]|uniref:energy-coupling factor ABC transporter permease n=1 Tax=Alkalibacter mobilis TaxID=2787712 RepID=UPI0018A053C7|nr:energy-coupling factor ABC transporter permease [Alkalibacter mobilis]MBF7096395.1 energy-coupling factor ABC transporter permease [Alkalibacter mobilis]
MHMADALLSPAVGGAMWAAASGGAAYSANKLKTDLDDRKIPLMGVMGAFVFASQMINFTIPATGSSGHIGGGMLLAILLGGHAGFLTMASVLLIQALFFADGGLLALGANIFNLGFFTCYVAYPLIYKKIISNKYTRGRLIAASVISVVVALQLGAFSVVLQTFFSGKTELPFTSFLLLMQPIHLAIGLVEGLITAAVVSFVWNARPEIITHANERKPLKNIDIRKVIVGVLIATVVVGGFLSWFASENPDGLEWAIFNTTGTEELEGSNPVNEFFARIQEKTAFLPDYGFKETSEGAGNSGTSFSGVTGGIITMVLALGVGKLISVFKRIKS